MRSISPEAAGASTAASAALVAEYHIISAMTRECPQPHLPYVKDLHVMSSVKLCSMTNCGLWQHGTVHLSIDEELRRKIPYCRFRLSLIWQV
jgi:hypothetical protein